MFRLIALLILAAMTACQTNPMVCPTPEAVKLRKAKAHRMRYAMAKRKQALANNYDYFQESEYKSKSLIHIEEWDCPKPGLKHDKMLQKKAKDLQRRYTKNMKRVAKESEERTVTVTNNN
ncbi:MAG: hypothetical protein KF860_14130 [Cyclobacteriaceae bacterium]|nr:hypothetical protein [Cyclobacteriaceae bacterium]